MTPERFGELLRKPKLLSGQNATELEELIGRFPWCGPLRRLRYGKALLSGDAEDAARWRDRAAPFLRLGSVSRQAEQLYSANPAKAAMHFGFASEEGDGPTDDVELPERQEDTVGEPNVAEALGDDDATVDHYLQGGEYISEDVPASPTPIETFESYRAHRAAERDVAFGDLIGYAEQKPKRSKKRKPKRASTDDAPDIASETLASLLARQGHNRKAIRMYEQLSLRYPTKKATFAAEIEKLQQQETR